MKLIINIRGTNGAGKSTIPMSMMVDPDMYVIEKPYKGKPKKIATVFPSYKVIALGSYFNKTGGLDTFPNNELTQNAFWYILKKYPEYDILLEGIIASTIYSTYKDLFKAAEEKYPDRKVLIVNFIPPLEVCLERVQERNGGKPIKEQAVEQKWKTVKRCSEKFKQDFTSIILDTSKVSKEDMPRKFWKVINRYRKEG